jgi:6-pyruvoyltetrahydropterin/6-carboxytetrahydropterin synthase
MYELKIISQFAAAHQLRNFRHKCERLHGHNWKVEVFLRSVQLDSVGLVRDFGEIKAATNQVLSELDHRFLNELDPFREHNPSSEWIARYLYQRLGEQLNAGATRVNKVTVWESDTSCASYWEHEAAD